MKISFILPVLGDARQTLRINLIKEQGVDVELLAFQRKFHGARVDEHIITSLGNITEKKYYSRLLTYLKAIKTIRKKIVESDALYTYGLDLALVTWVSRLFSKHKPPINLEILDIREVLTSKGFTSTLARALQSFIVPKMDLLVVTTPDFVTEYLQKYAGLKVKRWQVVENKVRPGLLPSSASADRTNDQLKDYDIVIGYFGLLRCTQSITVLIEIARQSQGRIAVVMRGFFIGTSFTDDDVRDIPNLFFDGPFTSPDDLPEMYNGIDLVWACYPYSGIDIGNWMWARTNRFYEACNYSKPMITAQGTTDGREVERWGIGTNIELGDTAASVTRLLGVSKDDLLRWRAGFEAMPNTVFEYSNEHQDLINTISSIQTD